MVERRVTGTSSAAVDADRRRCRTGMSETRRSLSAYKIIFIIFFWIFSV